VAREKRKTIRKKRARRDLLSMKTKKRMKGRWKKKSLLRRASPRPGLSRRRDMPRTTTMRRRKKRWVLEGTSTRTMMKERSPRKEAREGIKKTLSESYLI